MSPKDLPMERRSMIGTAAAMATGALAGCALAGTASQSPRMPFAVPVTRN